MVKYILSLILVVLCCSVTFAVTMEPGDLLATGQIHLYHIDRITGDKEIIADGFQSTSSLAVSDQGDIYVVDRDRNQIVQVDPTISRFDPILDNKTVISSGGLLVDPHGLSIESDGSLIVVNRELDGRVVRVNPVTGEQSIVHSGEGIRAPSDTAISPNGDIYTYIDDGGWPGIPEGIVKINPVTGEHSIISVDDKIESPWALEFNALGELFLLQQVDDLLKIDLITGQQESVSTLEGVGWPADLFFTENGDLFVADSGYPSSLDNQLVRYDLNNSSLNMIAEDFQWGPRRIAVYIPEPTTMILIMSGAIVFWRRVGIIKGT